MKIFLIALAVGMGMAALITFYLRRRGYGRVPFMNSFMFGAQPTSELSRQLDKMFRGRSNEDVVSAVIVSLCIHVARADGVITRSEMDALRSSLTEHFISEVDHEFMAEAARATKEHLSAVHDPAANPDALRASAAAVMIQYEKYSGFQYGRGDRRNLLRFLALILYETLIADETIHPAEEELFDFIAGRLGLGHGQRASVKQAAWFNHYRRRDGEDPREREARRRAFEEESARRRAKEQRESGPSFDSSSWPLGDMDKAMRLFNLDRRYTRGELDKAWKKIAMLHHPDRFHNQPPEIRDAANERFLAYREAYEYLRARV